MRSVVSGNLAVLDGALAAIGGIGALRVSPCSFVGRAPAIARSTIACDSIELCRRVISRFGLPVAQLGGEVTRPSGKPRILAVLGRLSAVFSGKPAVVDRLGSVIGSFGAAQCGLGAFVCCSSAVAGRPIAFGPVEIAGRIVAGFSFTIAQPSRDVPVLGGHARLTTSHVGLLVGPGIGAVLGRLGAVFGCDSAVVDRLGAIVRGPCAPRVGLVSFIGGMLTVGRSAVTCGSVEIAGGVVPGFGLTVA